MEHSIPGAANVVIVGGGIIGCSIAYHLSKSGWKDVVLLEQNSIAGGTTWHAAGLIGRLRTSNAMTKINKYSAELYANLEKETGHPTGWKQVGSLIVAHTKDRMIQLERTRAMAEYFDVEVQMISADEAKERWQWIRSDDLLGGAWLPHDGKVIPKETTISLAKGAEKYGATIIENIRVNNVEYHNGQVSAVHTTQGTIECGYAVLSGGMWTRELGLRCGVNIPLYPVEHHYIVSEPIEGVEDDLPVGRDPDKTLYFRSEGNCIMLGAFQKYTKPWLVDRVPDDFSFQLLEPDWEKYREPLEAGKWRIPVLQDAKWQKFVNGPESFTPDNNFLLGEAPGVKNLYVAAGLNSVGIASAGGVGKILTEWMSAGEAPMDLWSVDIRRFAPFFNNLSFLRERVTEVLGLHYQTAFPNREFETGRNLRKSPLHDRLAAQGACFGSKMGLERPLFFAPGGTKPEIEYSFGKQNWFEYSKAEHTATRENVTVFDQTSFSKFILKGGDTVSVLQRLCGNDVDVAVGKVVYTGMFNSRGTFESDLTVIRVAENEYSIITATSQTVHDFDWILRNVKSGEQVELIDVTTASSIVSVMGPNARAVLGKVTDADLSNGAFPYGTSQVISIGHATVRAARITYVGELGWELHIPGDQVCTAYDAVMAAGKEFGIVNGGHYAINSLRLEKGYRAWGADISPDDTPLEAGLGFAVAWNKPVEFIGKEALLKQKETGLKRRLAIFVLQNPDEVLWGSEPIFRNGTITGYTTSGAYGYTIGGAVGMGYINNPDGVDTEYIRNGEYEIEISGKRVAAKAYLQPPYDPKRERILG